MEKIKIDFSNVIGKIKPLHGVGQPPFTFVNFKMFKYLKDAGIPFSRLHDVGGAYGAMRFVDIPNLFRDFNADPADPDSYDFAFTDLLISALIENGVEPFFRLGVTIENQCEIKAYRIFPPTDNLKWAKICEGVIRHYTEGWANGFHYDIKYWEIWNEPDNMIEPSKNPLWQGTKEQFFDLYNTAAPYLKEKFPHLKIGGYGSCGFYAACIENPPERFKYFIEFFEDFLKSISKSNAPLDFFSWHCYSDEFSDIVKFAQCAREKLDEYGFHDTETSCNEWNLQINLKGTIKHAALVARVMLSLQDAPVDNAMFYDARYGVSAYAGLFNPLTAKPFPAYYVFKAFNELYVRGNQVQTVYDCQDLYTIAATNSEDGFAVLANISDEPIELQIESDKKIVDSYILDETHNFDVEPFNNVIPPQSVIGLRFE